jgi:hypothetical protein
MATVRAYSVCQSDGTNNAPTVYSYSVAPDLQDGSPLAFSAATPEDAMRTGLQPAYCAGGAATAAADAIGYANTGGLTPTLINGAAALTTGAATDLTLTTAGAGNTLLSDCARVLCSTTNLTADMLGAGLQVAVSTNANGVPTLLATDIIVAGGGYAEDDVVGLDGFPGTEVTISIA